MQSEVTDPGSGDPTRRVASRLPAPKIAELDGLRGILAWWVVFGHVLGWSGFSAGDLPPPLRLIRSAALAVDVFMILSGFVVFLLLDTQRLRFGPFLIRRAFRLYPVFILCLVLALLTAPSSASASRCCRRPTVESPSSVLPRRGSTSDGIWCLTC